MKHLGTDPIVKNIAVVVEDVAYEPEAFTPKDIKAITALCKRQAAKIRKASVRIEDE